MIRPCGSGMLGSSWAMDEFMIRQRIGMSHRKDGGSKRAFSTDIVGQMWRTLWRCLLITVLGTMKSVSALYVGAEKACLEIGWGSVAPLYL
jgi:hypothetical protein